MPGFNISTRRRDGALIVAREDGERLIVLPNVLRHFDADNQLVAEWRRGWAEIPMFDEPEFDE